MAQHLSTLFSSLENIKKTTELDEKYKISELTLAQQRELIVSVFDPFETPAKLGIAFNNIINSCVETTDGTNKDITIVSIIKNICNIFLFDVMVLTILVIFIISILSVFCVSI